MKKASKRTPRKREVRIADLKANLSEHLRAAQRGQSVTVLDRDTPIARIVPIEKQDIVVVRAAKGRPMDLPPPAPMPKLDIDVLRFLAEERRERLP